MNNRNDAQPNKESSEQSSEASKTQASASKSQNQHKPNIKRKQANFATMSNLMNKLVVKLGLDQRLKEHALMYLWPSIVGDTFATNSRCLFIDNERKLVVSVKDASVGQELSLLRREILRKMQIAAHNLGVKVEGIRFDMKHFHKVEEVTGAALTYTPSLPQPTEEDLQSVMLTEEELTEIEILGAGPSHPEVIRGSGFTSKLNISKRMATIFEHELRLKKWRAANDYPICSTCLEPAHQLHGDGRICAHCFYKLISPKSI
jgi:Dna[CI] antecedent, DciA